MSWFVIDILSYHRKKQRFILPQERQTLNSKEFLSSGNAIFYWPKKFAIYINCDKSCCNNPHQKSELSQGLKESKPESKKLQKTQPSQQSFEKNLQESFTASIPCYQETVFSRSY